MHTGSVPTPLPRTAFPVTARWAYLDHAGVCPLPRPAADAMAAYAHSMAADGRVAHTDLRRAAGRVRRGAARLMGTPAGDLAVVKNTTEGLAFVAGGLQWRPGDRVVVPGAAFPSVVLPWLALRAQGVRVDVVEPAGPDGHVPVGRYAEAIAGGPPPRLVVASWVHFASGWRTDLEALAARCHEAGALLCVDAIQGLGVLPARLQAWGVDFAAAGAQKWLLGPLGAGVLYVRRSRLPLLRPLEPGWNAVAHRGDFADLRLVFDEGARRLEGGTLNLAGLAALDASLELLLDAGTAAVWEHVSGLLDHACTRLREVGAAVTRAATAAQRSAIVVFRPPRGEPDEVVARLRDRGIVCVPRGAGIRLAPHGYNTLDEIDELVDAVAAA